MNLLRASYPDIHRPYKVRAERFGESECPARTPAFLGESELAALVLQEAGGEEPFDQLGGRSSSDLASFEVESRWQFAPVSGDWA